jgi:uncharacterized caspase-like protein
METVAKTAPAASREARRYVSRSRSTSDADEAPDGGEQAPGERYALLVGVRKYDPNELRSLPYAEADVEDLGQVLLASGYRPENVVMMTQHLGADEPRFLPLAVQVRKELDLLLRDREPSDTVLVAFAGHGIQSRGDGVSYFCPADAKLDDKQTLIPLDAVYSALEGSRAGLRLRLVDACRNDPQSDNSRSRSVVNLESLGRPQIQEPPGGVAAFFSCSAGQRAYEHVELKHGVFFHFVIDALRLPDLERYVKRRVADFARARYGVRQHPSCSTAAGACSPW